MYLIFVKLLKINCLLHPFLSYKISVHSGDMLRIAIHIHSVLSYPYLSKVTMPL